MKVPPLILVATTMYPNKLLGRKKQIRKIQETVTLEARYFLTPGPPSARVPGRPFGPTRARLGRERLRLWQGAKRLRARGSGGSFSPPDLGEENRFILTSGSELSQSNGINSKCKARGHEYQLASDISTTPEAQGPG